MTTKRLIFLLLICVTHSLMAQDIVKLINGDQMVGDLKELKNGVLEMETDYSESNFLVDWESVTSLKAVGMYIINLTSGEKLNTSNTSTEGFAAIDYNAFGLDDVSITSNLQYYPSLSEKGRHRVNFTFDLKFDLPRDFYIGGSYTLNYDNQPLVEDASTTDYIIQTVIG